MIYYNTGIPLEVFELEIPFWERDLLKRSASKQWNTCVSRFFVTLNRFWNIGDLDRLYKHPVCNISSLCFKTLQQLLYVDTLKKITTTPLLEYLKLRKQERQRLRDEKREERRRRDFERRKTKDDPIVSKVS